MLFGLGFLYFFPGFVPVWIPPLLLWWETGREESLSELKPAEQWVEGGDPCAQLPPSKPEGGSSKSRASGAPSQAVPPTPVSVPACAQGAALCYWAYPSPILHRHFRKHPIHWDIWGFASWSQAEHSGGMLHRDPVMLSPMSMCPASGRRGKSPRRDRERDRGERSDVAPCGGGSRSSP